MKFSIKDWKQCSHENNVPSRLSSQWPCYNSSTWADDVSNHTLCVHHVPTSCTCNRTSSAQVHELPPSHCSDKWDSTLFSLLHVCYAHLASVRFLSTLFVVDHFWTLLTTMYMCMCVCIYIYVCIYICMYILLLYYILCCYYDECVRQGVNVVNVVEKHKIWIHQIVCDFFLLF